MALSSLLGECFGLGDEYVVRLSSSSDGEGKRVVTAQSSPSCMLSSSPASMPAYFFFLSLQDHIFV